MVQSIPAHLNRIRHKAHATPTSSFLLPGLVSPRCVSRLVPIRIVYSVAECLPFYAGIQHCINATLTDAKFRAPGVPVKRLVLEILLRSGTLPITQTKSLRSRDALLTFPPL
jgi:hypothetical protein